MREILISIKQDMPGFDPFIGSWLCQGDLNILVDVGPPNSAHRLVESLSAMHVDRLDYVLLTHIHIDHSGGLAELLEHFPTASVICHENSIQYLVDPSRLWSKSREVLGEIACLYGRPNPIREESLVPHNRHHLEGLRVIETPGHAFHHLSFLYNNSLFVGEAAGIFLKIGHQTYLRPASPPRFFLDASLRSIDLLASLQDTPICYPHFGRAESSSQMLELARKQLMFWKTIILREIQLGSGDLVERCVKSLLNGDQNLEAFNSMNTEQQGRELNDMVTCVKGFIGALEKTA